MSPSTVVFVAVACTIAVLVLFFIFPRSRSELLGLFAGLALLLLTLILALVFPRQRTQNNLPGLRGATGSPVGVMPTMPAPEALTDAPTVPPSSTPTRPPVESSTPMPAATATRTPRPTRTRVPARTPATTGTTIPLTATMTVEPDPTPITTTLSVPAANVRSAPRVESDIIGLVIEGDELILLAQRGGWYLVQLGRRRSERSNIDADAGWIDSGFVSPPSVPPPTLAPTTSSP